MKFIKTTFYLPLEDNQGESLDNLVKDFEDSLVETFGGFTICGDVQGCYKMKCGSYCSETSTEYSVALPEDKLSLLRKLLVEFKGAAQQEALYLEIDRNVEVEFL